MSGARPVGAWDTETQEPTFLPGQGRTWRDDTAATHSISGNLGWDVNQSFRIQGLTPERLAISIWGKKGAMPSF